MIDSERHTDDASVFSDEGKRLALVVGVNRSVESEYLAPLQYAEHDASNMALALQTPACHFGLSRTLLGELATSSKVKGAIIDLINASTDRHFVCFYFSGHAVPMTVKGGGKEMYLVTHDFKESQVDVDPSLHLSMRWLWDVLCEHANVEKILLILDCCYAGNMPTGPNPYQLDLDLLIDRRIQDKELVNRSRYLLFATKRDVVAYERDGHSIMTGLVLKALRGEDKSAYDRAGYLDVSALYRYLNQNMLGEQKPTRFNDGSEDFLLAWYPSPTPPPDPDSTVVLNELLKRFEAANRGKSDHALPFDHTLCRDASLGNIDMEVVASLFQKERVQKQPWFNARMTNEELLEKLDLLKQGGLAYGAVLCFGRNPSKRVTEAFTRCIAYRGNDRRGGREEEPPEFRGSLLAQYESSLAFLQKKLCPKCSNGVEEWEIPPEVLREVLANALIHSEYADAGQRSCVRVEIFDDRIEITNPGGLYGSLTVDQLGVEGFYPLRNPYIAHVFYLCNYVEKLGTGIARMQDELEKVRLSKPLFDVNDGRTFKVTLLRPQRKGLEMITERESMLASSDGERQQVAEQTLSSNGAGAGVETEREGTLASSGVEHQQGAGTTLSLNRARVGAGEEAPGLVNGAESNTVRGPMSPLDGGESHYQATKPPLSPEDAAPHAETTFPSSSRRRRFIRRVQLISLVLIILLIATSSFVVFPGLFFSTPLGLGVINEPHSEQIGLSDGTYAFDTGTDRVDASFKKQGAAKLAQGDVVGATSQWNQATGMDTSDAEALIYLEDQRVLASGSPYITLVVATTLTGSQNEISSGRDDLQGAYVAQKEYNDGLKLGGGRQIRLLIANAGSKKEYVPEVAGQIVQAAKQDPTIVGVMGWYRSAYAQIAIPILTRAHIPMVSSTASADRLSGMSPYFFRVGATNKSEAIVGAHYAEEQLHASRVALFVDPQDAYSSNLADDFEQQFVADGHQIVDTENYTVGDKSNLPALLQKALKSNPDLIYFAGYADDLAVLLVNLGLSYPDLQILGGDGLYNPNAYSPTARLNLSRIRFTAFAYPDEWSILGLNKPLFFSEYPADFNPANADHSANPYGFTRADFGTILGYDATFALLRGCQNVLVAGKELTAVKLQGGLAEITGKNAIQGISGQISFGRNGDPKDKAVVILYVDLKGDIQMLQPNGLEGCFELGTCG